MSAHSQLVNIEHETSTPVTNAQNKTRLDGCLSAAWLLPASFLLRSFGTSFDIVLIDCVVDTFITITSIDCVVFCIKVFTIHNYMILSIHGFDILKLL